MDGGGRKGREKICKISPKGTTSPERSYRSERERDQRDQERRSRREDKRSHQCPNQRQTYPSTSDNRNRVGDGSRGRIGSRNKKGDGVQGGDIEGVAEHGGKDDHQREEEGQQRKSCGYPSRETLAILYLNALCIVKKTDKLACVASTLQPDLILVTESWCYSEISDAHLSLEGYEVQPDL
jgi:hypothetical protein